MAPPVVLVLGAGPNVGLSVATKFASEKWKVAAVSRSPGEDMKKVADLVLAADFTDSARINSLFAEVEAKLGTPNVVIYNAYSLAFPPDPQDPFSIPSDSFAKDLAVNTTSLYAAASTALSGFRKFPTNNNNTAAPTVFIYTGNMQNSMVVPETFSLGAGKNAAAYVIETAAAVYGSEYQFYYADERLSTGMPVMTSLDGKAHADFYWELAGRRTQGPWDATFVKGVGYVKFEAEHDRKVVHVDALMANIGK